MLKSLLAIFVMLVSVTSMTLPSLAAAPPAINGSWKADIPHGNGHIYAAILTFEVDETTLKGTVTAAGRDFPISGGKINDDEITFTLDGTDGFFSGKLVGDTIQMKVKYDGGENGRRTIPFLAKRAE